jgi:ATP-dependent exoDNAse (exonuclease V) beta subunit
VLDQARRFEAHGTTSFRAFVRRLEEDAERGAVAEAPVVEDGADGVRIMTVHKAKGLEFPIVILCDPTCPTAQREPSRYVDGRADLWATPLAGCTPQELIDHRDEVLRHDAEEGVRLLYVAATRAREMLVVPVVGDQSSDGWVDGLHPALYPRRDQRRSSVSAPGCPAFGEDTVLERPESQELAAETSVRPGLHTPSAGTHGVVWWDPHGLDLAREEEAGLRQQRILAADESKTASTQGEKAHRAWQALRASSLAKGGEPTLRVVTVTDRLAGITPAPGIEVRIERTEVTRAARPRGTRFGLLVHAVLATVDLGATTEEVSRSAVAVGRMLDASPDEVESAAEAARSALRHAVLVAARAPEASYRRETPVLMRLEDGALLEGVVDLAYRENTGAGRGWVVVDFKTDAELLSRQSDYERQVRLYGQAVTAATGESARCILLAV